MTKSLKQDFINRLRNDFPMLRNNKESNGRRFCYLDNGATSFKPDCVMEAENSYYEFWNANTHRGDYGIAFEADQKYLEARRTVADFIGSKMEEVIFTSGCTESLNMIAFGICSTLENGDEIILSQAEHASNLLPWFKWAKLFGLKIVFAPLDDNGCVQIDGLKQVLTEKTKVISLAHVSNVLGNVIDAKSIASFAHENNALLVLDGAQSVPHMKIDVKDLDCDFLAFSGHKMLGPSGIGVMYGKKELLMKISPLTCGGGMNATFDTSLNVVYEDVPFKFEAGTRNVAGAYGLARAIKYLEKIGMDNINSYEIELKRWVVKELQGIPGIIVYNPDSDSGIVDFNRDGVFSQDEGTLLNSKGICVRSGLHCAKILTEKLPRSGTVRASFYVYNNEEDAMQLVEALREGGEILDAYF